MLRLWSPLTNTKSFSDRIVGHPLLNRAGLHVIRILLADLAHQLRTTPLLVLAPRLWLRWQRDGYLLIEGFLPARQHALLQEESRRLSERYGRRHPLQPTGEQGFGARRPNADGFDRNDGDSVNRFIRISGDSPIDRHYRRSPRLARLTLALFGLVNRPARHHLYELVHGDESVGHDMQRDTHSDTFHHTFKIWYCLEDVAEDSGPTHYVPGSHRSGLRRLRWEYAMSVRKSSRGCGEKGGALRVSDEELRAMGLPPARPLPVPANTLVVLDTRGFHRRGIAPPGTVRRAIHANFRPWAFAPLAY